MASERSSSSRKGRRRSSTPRVALVGLVVLVLLSAPSCHGASSSTVTSGASSPTTPTSTVINLSYQTHIPREILRQAVNDHVDLPPKSQDTTSTTTTTTRLNLSHLALGDEGIQQVLKDIVVKSCSGGGSIRLDLSMNRLTPVGVVWLLQQLVAKSRPPSIQDGDENKNEVDRGVDTAMRMPIDPPIQALDLSWNYLASDALADTANLPAVMEHLIASADGCPTDLCFDQCSIGPALCRAIGKGLMQRFGPKSPLQSKTNNHDDDHDDDDDTATTTSTFLLPPPPPLSLSLSGNPDIGNAGTAALAAALRTIAANSRRSNSTSNQDPGNDDGDETATLPNVLERLDLSSCCVGDAGAEALALAMEDGCGPAILDLSNNQLQDAGVAALGRAIALAESTPVVRVLDLSNNVIGVAGCTALLVAMDKGRLERVILRSCHIHADGAEIIGKGLGSLVRQSSPSSLNALEIDLSGNPLGVLRGKNKKEGGKYSASRLKSTATATAASYMNILKKGMKDIGMDAMLGGGGASTESDDEEGEDNNSEEEDASSEFAKKRCGAKSMANAFLNRSEESSSASGKSVQQKKRIRLGLRHCFFDHEAADALAAMIVEAKDKYGADILLDVAMNPVLEDEMVSALVDDDNGNDDRRREMAERHMDILEALREAQERAAEARARARARAQARSEWGDREEKFGDLGAMPDFEQELEENCAYDSEEDSY